MNKSNINNLTYISLFSGGGIGSYGFKQEDYKCIATAEIIERRLEIQKYNKVCKYESGYINGDLKKKKTKDKVLEQIKLWEEKENLKEVDVLIATPPCQGISVANLKKKNEINRNSLVVESIQLTKKVKPKYFIFENVRGFFKAACNDTDGEVRTIRKSIELNLAGEYNILYTILNFKDYGCPSSRTRALVIGVRKDLIGTTPFNIFPTKERQYTVREVIGDLTSLNKMGEIDKDDIYHNHRPYPERMIKWIENLDEGESAFDNKDPERIPHRYVDGKRVNNKRKSGDKYKRWFWDRPAACIHTRNDQLASQNTIHPADNRVYSIRELMKLMTIPAEFKWSDKDFDELNELDHKSKRKFLKKNEMNIRQCIGEAVPTIIFQKIAVNIKKVETYDKLNTSDIKKTIKQNKLNDIDNLKKYINSHLNRLHYDDLSKIIEVANSKKSKNAAYYTRQDIAYTMVRDLPDASNFKKLKILEPSVGSGNFIPLLVEKYKQVPQVEIDVVDIDSNAIDVLKILINKIDIPSNFKINYIEDDFLLHKFDGSYDIAIGNPPFKKLTGEEKKKLKLYRKNKFNQKTNNIFSFFVEKSIKLAETVSLVVPKSLISTPELDKTRSIIKDSLIKICDYGQTAFKGVKIETISFINSSHKQYDREVVKLESFITKEVLYKNINHITDDIFPYWLLYRNEFFDKMTQKLHLDMFEVYRDRSLTNSDTKNEGKIKVIKARNIGNNKILDTPKDQYVDKANASPIAKKYFKPNNKTVIVAPNLSYYPRAAVLPDDCIVDGSAAILIPKNGVNVDKKDLSFFSSKKFFIYYRIARNYSTRSLNIDRNSVYFWGIPKSQMKFTDFNTKKRSRYLYATPGEFLDNVIKS